MRRHNAGQPAILREIEAMIALLDQRLADMDREIAALIQDNPELDEQASLLGAVPGIGPSVPATLLGELPELGTACRRRIASLARLASPARERGTRAAGRAEYGSAGARSPRLSASPPSARRDVCPHASRCGIA